MKHTTDKAAKRSEKMADADAVKAERKQIKERAKAAKARLAKGKAEGEQALADVIKDAKTIDANALEPVKAKVEEILDAAKPTPGEKYAATVANANGRCYNVLTTSDDQAVAFMDAVFPGEGWKVTAIMPNPKPGTCKFDATKCNVEGLTEVGKKALRRIEPDGKGSKPKASNPDSPRSQNKAKFSSVDPTMIKYDETFPRPKGLAEDVYWPKEEYDRAMWQFVCSGKYTAEEIAVLMAREGKRLGKSWTASYALKYVPTTFKWIEAAGLKPDVKK